MRMATPARIPPKPRKRPWLSITVLLVLIGSLYAWSQLSSSGPHGGGGSAAGSTLARAAHSGADSLSGPAPGSRLGVGDAAPFEDPRRLPAPADGSPVDQVAALLKVSSGPPSKVPSKDKMPVPPLPFWIPRKPNEELVGGIFPNDLPVSEMDDAKMPPRPTFGFESALVPADARAPTILLALSAFRDDFCHATVLSAFEQAANPDRLFLGIFQQWDRKTDVDCLALDHVCPGRHPVCSRLDHIRIQRVSWELAKGPTWGRHYAERFLEDEDFFFQVDSHSLFVPNWDVSIVYQWSLLENEFAVISSYPKDAVYLPEWYPEKKTKVCVICKSGHDKAVPRSMLKHLPCQFTDNPAENQWTPMLTAFWGAGTSFSKAHRAKNVPYDMHLPMLFDGEEFSLGVRLFTHGYDIYAPARDVVFHQYEPYDGRGNVRVRYWDFNSDALYKIMRDSAYRIEAMLGLKHDAARTDKTNLEFYSLGTSRTLADFLKWVDMDLANHDQEVDICKRVFDGSLKRVAYREQPSAKIGESWEALRE